MALVETLPALADCLGGAEHVKLVLDAMEMLFTVENETILTKVKSTVTQIYKKYGEVLRLELVVMIERFWAGEEQHTAPDMCLFFYTLMLPHLSDADKQKLIKILLAKFRKDDRTIKLALLEAISTKESVEAIKQIGFLKSLAEDIKLNIGQNPYMAAVRLLFLELLNLDDPEVNTKIIAIIKEVDKSTVRQFFKPSVVLVKWPKLKNIPEEDRALYDQDFVWKKLQELKVDPEKDESVDVKDSRLRKEIEIFTVLIENLDIEKIQPEFFPALAEILAKDEFFINVYMKNYWKLEGLAEQEGEKNKLLREAMVGLSLKSLREKTKNAEKIHEGLKEILKNYRDSPLVQNKEEHLQSLIDLLLEIENWHHRKEVVDILISLAKQYPQYLAVLKKSYSRLVMDHAYEAREHACDKFIEIVDLETNGAVDKQYVAMFDLILGQKSCFKRNAALNLLEVAPCQIETVLAS